MTYCKGFPRGFQQLLKNSDHNAIVHYLLATTQPVTTAEISAATRVASMRVCNILKIYANTGVVACSSYTRSPKGSVVKTYYLEPSIVDCFRQQQEVAT